MQVLKVDKYLESFGVLVVLGRRAVAPGCIAITLSDGYREIIATSISTKSLREFTMEDAQEFYHSTVLAFKKQVRKHFDLTSDADNVTFIKWDPQMKFAERMAAYEASSDIL